MEKSEQTLMMMQGLLTTEAPEFQEVVNEKTAAIRALVDGSPASLYALTLVTLEHEVEDAKRIRLNKQKGARA